MAYGDQFGQVVDRRAAARPPIDNIYWLLLTAPSGRGEGWLLAAGRLLAEFGEGEWVRWQCVEQGGDLQSSCGGRRGAVPSD